MVGGMPPLAGDRSKGSSRAVDSPVGGLAHGATTDGPFYLGARRNSGDSAGQTKAPTGNRVS